MSCLPHQQTRELGYAEITSTFAKPTAGAGAEDVTGLSIPVTVGSRPVDLHFWCTNVKVDTNNAQATVQITDSSNNVQASESIDAIANPSTGAGGSVPFQVWARINPTAGSYTYKVRINTSTGGAKPQITAATTARAFLRATEA